MGLENVSTGGSQAPDSSLENTNAPAERRRGRPAAAVPEAFATVLADYAGRVAASRPSLRTGGGEAPRPPPRRPPPRCPPTPPEGSPPPHCPRRPAAPTPPRFAN